MNSILIYISLLSASTVFCTDPGKPRQRLLFYDEDGSLVKTYANPYLQNLKLNAGLPIYGNFLNPFFGFIKDFGSVFAFTVPVSNEVIQQIKENPQYHNQLMVAPINDPVIAPNPLCEGKRAQIPSPNLCNNYLNCWDGWAVEQECPTGLLFSRKGYCDYSDNVSCESRRLKELPSTKPRCNKDFETFRNELSCNEFFVCVSRQPVKFKCPADLVYNQYLGVCDYPTRVDCLSTGINTEVFTIPSTSSKPITTTTLATAPIDTSAVPNPIVAPVVIPPIPLVPSPPIDPSKLNQPSPSLVSSELSEVPTVPANSILPPMSPPSAANKPDDIKTIYTENAIVNTQSWTSTHIATSLQDAIQQLQKVKLTKDNV